ncbi:L,D-transpeptidase family protein [Permianibacter sp. IMCC34836]|uniref:L,D-transpeptidase family protein n=1 Tax=Permianibacter fluminis TaxID=2738515 RepID=UPI0015558B41|nr:L,D-transpeptidase [Permianibacter fluminis]NQD39042.1 L,D-transpeptidase family protein [Permianibacter fluminis]
MRCKSGSGLPVLLAGVLLSAPFFPSLTQALERIDQPTPPTPSVETLLLEPLRKLQAGGDLSTAIADVDRVIARYPNFRLAHLIKGDLLLAHRQPLDAIGSGAPAAAPLQDLREEAMARLIRQATERPQDQVPKYLLQLTPEQRHALVIDIDHATLYVFENRDGVPVYVNDYYVSHGKNGADKVKEGDKRTPLGVYQITRELSKQKLPDFYGAGAFPLSYPNEWDKREKRQGHGIWLHGTPSNTYSRPPRASDGCVVLANPDFEALAKYVDIGSTPVIIAPHIEWTDSTGREQLRSELLSSVEDWRADWQSRDIDRYLSHYGSEFSDGKQNLANWAGRKRQVNDSKTWVEVGLRDVSVFLQPGRDDLAVVNFEQDYRSNNLSNTMRKQQYWQRENGAWRIVFEG